MLTPVDNYQFYQSGNNALDDEKIQSKNSGNKVAVDRRTSLDLATIESMIETFNLNKKDMLQLVQRIVHHVNASDEERAAMAHKKAGDIRYDKRRLP